MIGAYLIDEIVLKTGTFDKWNKATYKSSTIKSRIEYKTKMVVDLSGKQVVSSARIYLRNITIDYNDIIVFDDIDHSIIAKGKAKDFGVGYIFVDVA